MKVKFSDCGEQDITLGELAVRQCAQMVDGEVIMVTDEGFVSLTTGFHYQNSEHTEMKNESVKKRLGTIEFSD